MTVQVTPIPKAKKRKTKKKQTLAAECDKLAGQIARSRGRCCTATDGLVECKGNLQWAHGFGRGYHAVRYDPRNGFCQCAAHHFFYTNRPIQWDDWLRAEWGDDLYAEMRALALTYRKPDLKVLVVELRQEAIRAAA